MAHKKIDIRKYVSISARLKENYKSLRANIDFCGNAPRVILVTSSIPGEGKSTVSLQLAHEIALSGKSVLMLMQICGSRNGPSYLGFQEQIKKAYRIFWREKSIFRMRCGRPGNPICILCLPDPRLPIQRNCWAVRCSIHCWRPADRHLIT